MPRLDLAWRSLRRSPAFALTAIATLAIGVSATTTIGTVLRAVVLEPLPYADADRLYSVRLDAPGLNNELGQSPATYFPFKQFARSIEAIAVYDPTAVDVADISHEGQSAHLRAALITDNTFTLLGATFQLGRPFTAAEDAPHGPLVAILTDGLWRERYGADRHILGKRILVDGQEREIVGVAAAGFGFPDAITQLWLPIALDPHARYARDFRHRCIVKLRPDVTPAAAMRELDALLPRGAEQFPDLFPGVPTAEFLRQSGAHTLVRPLRDDIVGPVGRLLWIATAAGVLILLTAGANVASLVLTRAEHRQRELAVRTALGASARQVISQDVIECGLLATLGGVVGLLLSELGLAVLRRVNPILIPRVAEAGVDFGALVLVLGITCAVALLMSAVPVLRRHSLDLTQSLRDRARTTSSGRAGQRARRAFVITQVAFAAMLTGGGTLLLRSVDGLRNVQPGFDAGHTLALWLSLPRVTYHTDNDVVRFTDRLLRNMAAVPGVRGVAVSATVPLNRLGRSFSPIWTDDDATPPGALPPAVLFNTATGDYFRTMSIPVIAGRTFFPLDRQRTGEVIIDRTVATQFWHDSTGQRALGRQLRYTRSGTPPYTVIGVVGAVYDTSLATRPMGQIYLPDVQPADPTFEQVPHTFATVIRFGASGVSMAALRSAIRVLDPTIAAYDVSPLSDVLAASMARLSFVTMILTIAAIVALTLAAIGLYGVTTYVVTLRTPEIGLRIALGARPDVVARWVTYQGAVLAALGVAAGVALFTVASRFLRSLLFGVGVADPVTLIAVSTVLMLVALAASWVPARRAARIDPVRALASEP